jgi:hypothetical protein
VLCWQSAVQGKHLPREMSSENLYGIKIGRKKKITVEITEKQMKRKNEVGNYES